MCPGVSGAIQKGKNEWETGEKWGTEATGNRDVTVNRNGKEYICHLRESEGVVLQLLSVCVCVRVFYPSLLQQCDDLPARKTTILFSIDRFIYSVRFTTECMTRGLEERQRMRLKLNP